EPDAQQDDVDNACEAWKAARKYWEQSESFLYGPATDFGIDPHTDTWPFDRTAFDNYIRRYPDLAEDEDAQAIVAEAIATGQSLTGFHAVEYLLFRNGSPRNIEDITNNELWFCAKAAEDLYLASVKLVSAWGGEITEDEEALLEEAEFESRNYGENMINAGKAGSTYTSITLGTIQILEGCQDIIDEVAHSKIGHPYTGEDQNYIESPHAYNSIQDFYDNVLSCAFALNGGANKINNYTANSVMAYAFAHYPEEANNVKQALEDTLSAINDMKRPFVLNYQDSSAGKAIEALENLDEAIDALKEKLDR
ncbi:MAG: peptidase M75, partial [Bacteroidaceae bacterium]|nr:peptidase M75 [Bacteroidaceae bacterium]